MTSHNRQLAPNEGGYILMKTTWKIYMYVNRVTKSLISFMTQPTFTPTLAHASRDLGLVRTYLLSSNLGSSKLKRLIFGVELPPFSTRINIKKHVSSLNFKMYQTSRLYEADVTQWKYVCIYSFMLIRIRFWL